jgi:inorganic triphosphatase YgiF
MGREIELKLGVPEKALPRLTQALHRQSGAAPVTTDLTSTYYDTADLALKRCALSLRVREKNGRFIQGVKSSGSGNLSRGEWEEEITSADPDLAARRTIRHLPKQARRGGLKPLFTTAVQRTALDLATRRATRIEAAIDRGEIRAGRRRSANHELELELKDGEPAALYDLALRLFEIAPLEIGTPSKAARGYGLIDPQADASWQAQAPINFRSGCTADEALQLIGRSCLDHLMGNVAAALAGREEGIHQMRVAARRLRSLLSAAKTLLPSAQRRWASDALKYLADALGGARNWDAFTGSLIPDASAGMNSPGGLKLLQAAAQKSRARAYTEAQHQIRSREYGRSVLRLLRWVETRGWWDDASPRQRRRLEGQAEDAAALLLDRCLKQVRTRGKDFGTQSPAERHKLRIAVKKLRYTIAFFADLYPEKQSKRFVARLKPLQEALGQANDVRTAQGLLRELQPPSGTGRAPLDREFGLMLGWHERGAQVSEAEINRALRDTLDADRFWR